MSCQAVVSHYSMMSHCQTTHLGQHLSVVGRRCWVLIPLKASTRRGDTGESSFHQLLVSRIRKFFPESHSLRCAGLLIWCGGLLCFSHHMLNLPLPLFYQFQGWPGPGFFSLDPCPIPCTPVSHFYFAVLSHTGIGSAVPGDWLRPLLPRGHRLGRGGDSV